MADLSTPVTAADQTLIFVLMGFVMDIHKAPADQKIWATILTDVLPHVTQDHPIIEPMIAPAVQYIRTIENGRRSGGEYYDAIRALAKFAQWRAARSWDVFQEERPTAEKPKSKRPRPLGRA